MIDFINTTNWEFIVAILAIITSVYSIYSQRIHNRLTFKPLPVILKFNFNNRVKVMLWNKGNGPLFITSFKVLEAESLIDVVPIETRKLTFVNFISTIRGRVVSPSENLNLLEFMVRLDESQQPIDGYETALEKIKKSLNGIVIYIEYKNIYGNKYKYSCEKLDFGNLVNEKHSIRKINEAQLKRKNENQKPLVKKTSIFKRFYKSIKNS